jgi:hypothetical protein
MQRWIAYLSLALALGIRPPAARADEPAADPHAEALRRQVEQGRQREAEEEGERAKWREWQRERVHAVETARSRLAQTQANRVRAQDGAYDGVKRSEWTRRAEQARQELTEAQRALDEFEEEARKAEVPPSWLEGE